MGGIWIASEMFETTMEQSLAPPPRTYNNIVKHNV
jgi:hypothetical protein